jgi:hypothetical protein
MEIITVRTSVNKAALTTMAKQQFGDMVKAVVDVEQGIMAIGGELHSDEEALLLEEGVVADKPVGHQSLSRTSGFGIN